MSKPIARTKLNSPQLRIKGRSIIQNTSSYIHNPGEPIGLLLALTYSETLIPTWTTLVADLEAPMWGMGFRNQLTSPMAWTK